MEFKVGDKVKIPKTKHNGKFDLFSEEIKNYKKDFLYIVEIIGKNVSLGTTEKLCLGYDNFRKDEIELYEEMFPEKWCLKITEESIDFIRRAYDSLIEYKHNTFSFDYLKSDHSFGDRSIKTPTECYPEITLEQFKKHILQEKETMKKEIKVGSKVKCKPTTKDTTAGYEPGLEFVVEEIQYNDMCFPGKNGHGVLMRQLDLIEEPVKNLLETEFVIENCSLAQRLAIKAYCDEKNIKQLDLETPKFNVVTFSNAQFKCFLSSSIARNKVTFSELIQFLDQYQPEPEFKVGDHILFLDNFDDNKIGDIGCITSITNEDYYNNDKEIKVKAKGWINYSRKNHRYSCGGFRWEGNGYFTEKHFRHATPEEIKKWKEENEIKLPIIDGHKGGLTSYSSFNDTLSWGCTSISVKTVKELLKLNLKEITLSSYNIDNLQIQQIKKFIEHNEL